VTTGIFEVLFKDHEMMRQLFKRITKDRGILGELKKHLGGTTGTRRRSSMTSS